MENDKEKNSGGLPEEHKPNPNKPRIKIVFPPSPAQQQAKADNKPQAKTPDAGIPQPQAKTPDAGIPQPKAKAPDADIPQPKAPEAAKKPRQQIRLVNRQKKPQPESGRPIPPPQPAAAQSSPQPAPAHGPRSGPAARRISHPWMIALAVAMIAAFCIAYWSVLRGLFHTNPAGGAWLTNLQYSQKDADVFVNRNTSSRGTDGSAYTRWLSGLGSITYPLRGRYSSLSARWVLDADRPGAKADAGALRIYTDGALAFISGEISVEGNLYEDVYVNVAGCQELKIELVGYYYLNRGSSAFGNIGRLNNTWLELADAGQAAPRRDPAPDTGSNTPSSRRIQLLPAVSQTTSYNDLNTAKDSFGNQYPGGYYDFCSYHEKGKEPYQSYVILRTNGEWSRLRGRYFARTRQDPGYRITFQIYADDVLIYDSGQRARDDAPVDFDIDIRRADRLKLISYSDN